MFDTMAKKNAKSECDFEWLLLSQNEYLPVFKDT